MHHRTVKRSGYTLIEVALAVAVGATLLAAGVSIQSRIRQVAGLEVAKSQAAAIGAAMEMYYKYNGKYPNIGDGSAGAHLGTATYTALQPYLDSNFTPVNAYTGVSYTPITWNVDAFLPGQWWSDMTNQVGQIIICVRSSNPPGSERIMGMTDEGAQMGTINLVGTGKYYGVMVIHSRGYPLYMVKR